MTKFMAYLAALIAWVAPAWAQCELPKATAAAAGWSVRQVNGDWIARNPDYPGIDAEIFMNTPEAPRILDWAVPKRYDGRIGVLQHYAGEPGTSYLVTLVTNVVIDLETGAVLGEASASVDCVASIWHWYDTAIVVEDDNYDEVVIKLP